MLKRILIILISFILMMNLTLTIYADDELEENSISQEEIDEIIETATDITDIPSINSRYAVIYDRTSRKDFIW